MRSHEEAETLFLRYMKLVPYVAYQVDFNVTDDVLQEGYIGLWNAALRYDESKAQSFSTYAVPAIRNNILYARRGGSNSVKADVSLDQPIRLDDSIDVSLAETIEDKSVRASYLDADFQIYLTQKLTEEERTISRMRVAGITKRDIGAAFGHSDMWAINRIKRIKEKLKRDYRKEGYDFGETE